MNNNLKESEIDEIVIAQGNSESEWEEAVFVERRGVFPLVFSGSSEIVSEKEILGGTPVFRGTRVPVSALFDNLSTGLTVDQFLENFPSVSRKQAIEILTSIKESVSSIN